MELSISSSLEFQFLPLELLISPNWQIRQNHIACPVCRANLIHISSDSAAAAGIVNHSELSGEENDVVPVPVFASVSVSIAEDPVVNVDEPAVQVQVLNRNETDKPNQSVRGILRLFNKFRT
ncbi:hypothetical protein OSB04_un000049 [Centaurea solstitialis]|uniref:Uncharacterized protein n=1 Tax=Centaurea solstitialis TaxID=347529 RepID=A0AA38S5T1_9ASTR|nr:hypothetical protein OSB04_un000049 [Centaurea solstitialis]